MKEAASWGKRGGALLIDILFISISSLALLQIAALLLRDVSWSTEAEARSNNFFSEFIQTTASAHVGIAIAFGVVIFALYYGLSMMRTDHNGQSPGKQLLGIRVIREDGKKVGFFYAATRNALVVYLLFWNILGLFFLLPPVLNYLWPLWDQKNQALHDKIVKSRVVLG